MVCRRMGVNCGKPFRVGLWNAIVRHQSVQLLLNVGELSIDEARQAGRFIDLVGEEPVLGNELVRSFDSLISPTLDPGVPFHGEGDTTIFADPRGSLGRWLRVL